MTYSCLCKNAMKGLFTITGLCRWETEVQRFKQCHVTCMALNQSLIPDPASHHTLHDFKLPLWLTQITSHPHVSLHIRIAADKRQNLNTFLSSPWSLTHKLTRPRRKHPRTTQVWTVWPTYTWGLSSRVNTAALHNLRLAEPMDVEPGIQRNQRWREPIINYKWTSDHSESLLLTLMLFKSQIYMCVCA